MNIKEYTRSLVEAETAEARQAIAEEHMESLGNDDKLALTVEDLKATNKTLTETVAERDAMIVKKDQKFNNRFYGNEDANDNDNNDGSHKSEEKPLKTKTLSDLGFTKNGRG